MLLFISKHQPISFMMKLGREAVKRQGTTKSGGRKHPLDKFYTKPSIAKQCLQKLDLSKFTTIIEPSAGGGAFSSQIENVLAFDSAPENSSIIKQDWFEYSQKREVNNPTLVVGNPPFGQQNTLALGFINHAAQFAHTIAFILPISFLKESVQNQVDSNYHLVYSHVLPDDSFLLDGEEVNVACVFQIWEHSSILRKNPVSAIPVGFKWVRKDENPDFFLQRIGGNAGLLGRDWEDRNEQSNYFLKALTSKETIEKEFARLEFPYKDYSVGPRSISKKEVLNELLALESSLVKAP